MTFEEMLQELIKKVEGSLAAMLMGLDGISVAQIAKPNAKFDLELMGAEISAIYNQIRQSSFIDQFGETNEVVLRSGKTTILLKVIVDDYAVALVMDANQAIGKGRHYLKLIEPAMKKELV